jgi:transcriptional regulator with XRE-family HTH domain
MATYEDFTNWLLEQIEQRGWDQAELSRRSGVTTAQVSRIFTGERKAGPEVARKFARALGLPPETVFRQAGLLPKARLQVEGEEELLHLFAELTGEDRQRLLAIARTLRTLEQG